MTRRVVIAGVSTFHARGQRLYRRQAVKPPGEIWRVQESRGNGLPEPALDAVSKRYDVLEQNRSASAVTHRTLIVSIL